MTKMQPPQVITEEISKLSESDIWSVDDTKEQFWEKVAHKEQMIYNSWKMILNKIREQIVTLNKNNPNFYYHFNNKIQVKKRD